VVRRNHNAPLLGRRYPVPRLHPILPITLRHILPNTAPVLFAYVGSNAGQAIIAYAALAFIGLGADPTRPDWGGMLFEYRMFVFDSPMLMLWPGLAIAITAGLLNWVFDPEAVPAAR
jgi:peptide/nickel transport system permease protein